MPRLFSTHPLRHRVELNGVWSFLPLHGNSAPDDSAPPPLLANMADHLPVPGVWEASLAFCRHRGLGWYQRTFQTDRAGPVRLVFEAVSHTAVVWLDGRKLGEHYGAHTEFEFILPMLSAGEHLLAVRADNRFGAHNPLSTATQDIFTWGGIPRPVFLEHLPDPRLQDCRVVPRRENGAWRVAINFQLARFGDAPWPAHVEAVIGETQRAKIPCDRNGKGHALISIEDPNLWSPEEPALYPVEIVAGSDRWCERIGFRTLEVRGSELLLNGEPLRLRGVNRHEFHPDFGSALPPALHLRDLEILKQLGANFVRGSHYPNDPFFLDLCDEHGIVFFAELSHWQPDEETMGRPAFLSASLAQAEEMVRQQLHHPSIFFWGMLNEAEFQKPGARGTVEALARRFRELDPTRWITYATDKPQDDLCLEFVDVVSVNFYPGWYGSELADVEGVVRDWIEAATRRGGGKPILISEFGAAAIDGVRSFEDRKWTENYQATVIERVLAAAERYGVVGACVWQFCDVRTNASLALGRAREYNNKGILTEYREPKLAFYSVQRLFQAAATRKNSDGNRR